MPCCVRRSFSHSEAGEAGWRRAAGQAVVVVAYWRGRMFPASAGATLLQYTSTDDAELETLPVVNGAAAWGSWWPIMRWMQAATIMGRGAARSVQVDVSALGRAVSGSLLMIDKHTMVSSGPTAAAESPTAQMTITLNRYAVAFLSLKP